MGSNPCRRFLLLGIAHPIEDHYFRYRDCSGRRRSLERPIFRRKSDCGFDVFGIRFVEHVLKL